MKFERPISFDINRTRKKYTKDLVTSPNNKANKDNNETDKKVTKSISASHFRILVSASTNQALSGVGAIKGILVRKQEPL